MNREKSVGIPRIRCSDYLDDQVIGINTDGVTAVYLPDIRAQGQTSIKTRVLKLFIKEVS